MTHIVEPAHARLAAVVAAAGRHHLAIVGSPGTGKPLLAAAVYRLLPDLTAQQATRVARLAAMRDELTDGRRPPWRAPHHTASLASIIGGRSGERMLPGAVSLANDGILFLDEVAEFPDRILHAITHPLNQRQVVIAHAGHRTAFPAAFQLVTASVPCPAAREHDGGRCTCAPLVASRYLRRARVLTAGCDLRVDLDRPAPTSDRYELAGRSVPELAARVVAARRRAARRWRGQPWTVNADAPADAVSVLPRPVTAEVHRQRLAGALNDAGVLAVLRVAWTLADLVGLPAPDADDVTHALRLHGIRW